MRVRPLLLLAMITAFAGVLRLLRIEQYPFSDAETAFLASASDASAAPLPHAIYRTIGHFTELTPLTARLLSAIAGTMMVPAAYFLIRRWFSPRVALAGTLLVACSTFLAVRSREVSATMPLVFMATLSFGFLAQWLRTERRGAWLAWAMSSAAMLGLGAAGLLVLAIQPAFLVFRRREAIVVDPTRAGPAMASLRFWTAVAAQEARACLLFAIGIILSLSGMAGYLWTTQATPPALPAFTLHELVPGLTQIVFGFRWMPEAAVTSVMTLMIAATAIMLLMCVAAPLLRVPARPVWATLVALLVVINLTLFCARFALLDRPPVHLLARDVEDAQGSESIGVFSDGSGPRVARYDVSAVAASTHLKRVMLWEVTAGQDVVVATTHPPAGWRLHRDNRYVIYDPWAWRHVSTWRRREFVRVDPLPEPADPPKTTRPSLAPAAVTQPGPV